MLRRRVIQVMVGGGLVLIVMEIGLRQFRPSLWPYPVPPAYYFPDAAVGYKLKPSLSVMSPLPDGTSGVEVVTNSLGYRDREYAPTKSDDVFRILIVGDTFVESPSIPQERSFHEVLEGKYHSRRARSTEIIALGVSGASTSQEYEMLRNDGLPLSPDLVILAVYTGDDVDGTCFHYVRHGEENKGLGIKLPFHSIKGGQLVDTWAERRAMAVNYSGPLPRYAYRYYFTYHLLSRALHTLMNQNQPVGHAPLSQADAADGRTLWGAWEWATYRPSSMSNTVRMCWEAEFRLIQGIGELCASHEADLMVLLIPHANASRWRHVPDELRHSGVCGLRTTSTTSM
ncbi:MAG: hypothetical protein HYY13_04870 [Nitrospirae bacterium]|nr:hypothetical protein [Nitrospirota bacterium]